MTVCTVYTTHECECVCVTCETAVADVVPGRPALDEMFCGELNREAVWRPFIEEVDGQNLLLKTISQLQLEQGDRFVSNDVVTVS